MPSIPKTQMISMAVLFGWRYLDVDLSEGGDELFYLRCAYTCSMAVSLACYAVLFLRIKAMPEGSTISVTTKEPMKDAVTEEITTAEHDWRELKKLLTQAGIGMVMIPFLHLKWAYTIPLVVQSVNVPVAVLTHKLAQVHLFGNEAVGAMARPWKPPPGPFDGFTKLAEGAAGGGEEEAATAEGKKKGGGKKKRS